MPQWGGGTKVFVWEKWTLNTSDNSKGSILVGLVTGDSQDAYPEDGQLVDNWYTLVTEDVDLSKVSTSKKLKLLDVSGDEVTFDGYANYYLKDNEELTLMFNRVNLDNLLTSYPEFKLGTRIYIIYGGNNAILSATIIENPKTVQTSNKYTGVSVKTITEIINVSIGQISNGSKLIMMI